MDPSVPCEDSFFPVAPDQLIYIVAEGYSGIADIGSHDGIGVRIDPTGQLKRRIPGFDVTFDYTVPTALREGIKNPSAGIACNNSKLLLLRTYRGTGEQLLVFRKQDRTWRRVPMPGEKLMWVRAFGKFVAITEAWTKGAQAKESAGRAGWRAQASAHGPSTFERLRDSESVFPGRLHLYDVESERLLTIETKQADSEILLVDRNIVYYRVAASLYAAEITEKGIANTHLLAESAEVGDAHWAFYRR